jgi:hypothetical protein
LNVSAYAWLSEGYIVHHIIPERTKIAKKKKKWSKYKLNFFFEFFCFGLSPLSTNKTRMMMLYVKILSKKKKHIHIYISYAIDEMSKYYYDQYILSYSEKKLYVVAQKSLCTPASVNCIQFCNKEYQ